jgi:hypothetical protein
MPLVLIVRFHGIIYESVGYTRYRTLGYMYEISDVYLYFCIVFVRRVIELFSEPPWKSGNENPYTRIRWCWENNNTLQVIIHTF